MQAILRKLRITIEIPKVNVSGASARNYVDFYDAEGRDLVAKIFERDIVQFGYKFK